MGDSCQCRRQKLPPIVRPIEISRALLALALGLLLLAAPLGAGTAHAEELPPGGTFVDDNQSVHEGYIEAIADEQITTGCDDDRYCPTDTVTRGQMAAFLARAFDLPAASQDYFSDDDGSIFEADINAIAAAGFTTGCQDGTVYCPRDPVTRGQMAKFLRRAGNLPASSTNHFSDDEGDVFEDDINAIAEAGVTAGCNPPDNTRYCPDVTTTRAQMATFLGRLLNLEPMPPPDPDPTAMTEREAIERWFPDIRDQAIRVADCESSLNEGAVNPAGYHGLFQIGEGHRSAFERVTGQSWGSAIYEAYYNAQYARDLYDRSGGWGPWGCKP